MDRLINNESIVICAVVSGLIMDINEISKLYLFAVLTGDRAIRKRLLSYTTYDDLVAKESAYYQALNRKFIEFQPVFFNAMTMLEMAGKIEKTETQQYNLSQEGLLMAIELQQEQEGVEKPREFDPRGQATMTPAGKNTLTPYGKIKMTPENDCFSGAFL